MIDANILYYRVDPADKIVDIGGPWDAFAHDNGGLAVLKAQVLGTKLYQHIKGESSRTYIWTVLDGVRKLEKPVVRDYRCDSPTCKRFMTMRVIPEPENMLLLEHRLVSTEAFDREFKFSYAPRQTQTKVTRCSMCNRLQMDGKWGEPDHMLAKKPTNATFVIYSVCQDCKAAAVIPPHFL